MKTGITYIYQKEMMCAKKITKILHVQKRGDECSKIQNKSVG